MGGGTKSSELKLRAWIGFVAISQMRGNYPAMTAYARRAARLAKRANLPRLAREAHSGLMIAASVKGDVSEALSHGWRVYELSKGNDLDEGETLQNLGQVALNAGLSD